jgi:murein DD-endopeptidase MepM/ murein hydrolase activator NlpD
MAVVAAFGTSPDASQIAGQQTRLVEHLAVPDSSPVTDIQSLYVHEDQIRPGDTASSLFTRLGLNTEETLQQLRDLPEAHAIFRQMAPGRTVTARMDSDGTLDRLTFPLTGNQPRNLLIERQGNGYRVSELPMDLETHVVMKSAEIQHSLFGAADAADIPDNVAIGLADIFGGDIDFHHGLQKGDRFSVTYEAISHQGRPIQTGRILAAEFVNNGKTFRAAWYGNADGTGSYYAPDGTSLRKTFLRSPLEFSRVTSGFSNARFHPVLQKWRAHRGVDYGAPTGARVKATSDGVVEFAGRQGGYGNVIVLRHQGRYTTLYGHLSGFSKGIRTGKKINQGDVIGFVGATGLATGPHLHYEFRVDGVYKNPLAFLPPPATPLNPSQIARFREQVGSLMARLDQLGASNISRFE